MKQVCVVGLGYVGLTLAVYLARQGKSVYGVEIADHILESLKNKKAHFYEAGFDTELKAAIEAEQFTFGKRHRPFEKNTVFIVTVGTPLGEDGNVNLAALQTVSNNIAEVMQAGDVVILRSTVKVGTTRNVVKACLDKAGKQYHLGFCPERTLEGSAFEELASLPQIISGLDEEALGKIEAFFEPVCHELVAMNSVEEAEMVKLLNNSERDLMFALGNEVALMCDAKGLDAYKIIEAANHHYPRSNLKKPGPVGGPCLEKDPYILTEGFHHSAYEPTLFTSGRRINESIIEKGLGQFLKRSGIENGNSPEKIAVMGFAFKGSPPTGDVRGSLVYQVIETIKNYFPYVEIVGHDYLATIDDMMHAGATRAHNDILSVIENTDLIIFQNNHPQYRQEPWLDLKNKMPSNVKIFDFWNQLSEFEQHLNYTAFGRGK